MKRILALVLGLCACAQLAPHAAQAHEEEFPAAPPSARIEIRTDGPTERELSQPTRVVVLGTGTPIPDAYRAGSSIAVIHRGQAYLFDAGAGTVRNAVRARYQHDIPALYPSEIAAVFFTHLHSDHTVDFVELSHTLWWRRLRPLRAFGPKGLRGMARGLYAMMKPDIKIRTSGNQPVRNPKGYRAIVREITGGVVFDEDGLRVEAFSVPHGQVKPAFGYRVTTPDLKIVISGDTAYSDKLKEMSTGADYLFHEVISDAGLAGQSEFWQRYHTASHTLASQVGEIAQAAGVKTVVLYHGLFYGTREELVIGEAARHFDGKVVLATDLDLFE